MGLSAGKTLFGVSMLAFGGWSFAGAALKEQTFSGIVNAPTVTLYAPVSGQLKLSSNQNEAVAHGDAIAQITPGDERAAISPPTTQSRSGALRNQIATLQAMSADLDVNLNAYTRSRTDYLEAQMQQASAIHDGLLVRVEQHEKTVRRADKLAASGHISSSDVETQEADLQALRLDLQSAAAKLRSSEIELAAARNGTFIGEGYNDVPFSSQRKIDVELRISELQRELQEIGDDGSRVAQASASAVLNSPVDGKLWRVNYAEGQFVETGSAIAQVVNCQRLTAEIELPATAFDRLNEGDAAFLQLAGSDRRVEAKVNRLAAKAWNPSDGARPQDGALAGGGASYVASIDIDTDALGAACPVGRQVSVAFDDGHPSMGAEIADLSRTYTASFSDLYDSVSSMISSELLATETTGDSPLASFEAAPRWPFAFLTAASAKSEHD